MVIDPNTGVVTADIITHPALTQPADDIQAGDYGRILVSMDGQILEFESDGFGHWNLATNPWFGDVMTYGGRMLIPRSRTNFVVARHATEAFRHTLPNQFAPPEYDCDADVDEDGDVDVDDLIAVILAWEDTGTHGGFINEDVNRDAVIAVDDLIQVILSWGPCP